MIDRGGPSVPPTPYGDSRLAELTEEITRRLLAGEAFDAEAYVAQHPDCAGPIRDLLPTMHHLVELARIVACERPEGPRSDQSHSLIRKDPLP
ncbi:hypothetical protein SAMN05444166_5840 [Singulisphaera sp. GP187]|uniref:hypothetical protein n=1 Tax=Singulisphaera sp. GP187 TaxID=1882752 RepID=UPI000929F6E0|nr:hypothetical protein [Singulisphaera sp. GP187]SIO58866.1 hypothetical protein SAMN05444166_5840 [Singulisphaera sp. GP187]